MTGFVQWYLLALIMISACVTAFMIGEDYRGPAKHIFNFFLCWLLLLPMIGRVYGWW